MWQVPGIDPVLSAPFRQLAPVLTHGHAKRRARCVAALLLSVAVLGGTTAGLQAQVSDPAEARRQLEASKYQLDEAQRRSKELQADVARIHDEREQLNKQLIATAQKIQGSEAQLTAIEARQDELGAQESLIRGSLEKSHGSISSLLAAMQRMGRNPPPVLITRREDALSMVRSAMLLASAFPEMRGQAVVLSDKLGALVHVIDEGRTEKEHLRVETATLQDNRTQLASLIETRKTSLAARQDELVQVRKAAADIGRNVTDLNELLARLDKAVADKTRLGAYERELAAAQPKAAPPAPSQAAADAIPEQPVTPPPGSDGGTKTATAPPAVPPKRVASLGKPADDLRPSITLQPGERLAMATPGRIEPAIPFSEAVGHLRYPAQGNLIQRFGDHVQSGHSDGIVIETRSGAQVVAPNDGWVMYAGEFRSYGQILIINAGGGYHVLLAGLSQINVQVGQFVLAGEPVGVMTAAPKTAPTKTQDNAPVLYVEFRKNQRPIDPGPWWAETMRKVAG